MLHSKFAERERRGDTHARGVRDRPLRIHSTIQAAAVLYYVRCLDRWRTGSNASLSRAVHQVRAVSACSPRTLRGLTRPRREPRRDDTRRRQRVAQRAGGHGDACGALDGLPRLPLAAAVGVAVGKDRERLGWQPSGTRLWGSWVRTHTQASEIRWGAGPVSAWGKLVRGDGGSDLLRS